MIDDQHVITRNPDIELCTVDTQFLCVGKSCYRVFGRILHAVLMLTAMSDDFGQYDGRTVAHIEFDCAERILASTTDERHEIAILSGGNSFGKRYGEGLQLAIAFRITHLRISRKCHRQIGRRCEPHLVARLESVAVNRVSVSRTDSAASQINEICDIEGYGGLRFVFHFFV